MQPSLGCGFPGGGADTDGQAWREDVCTGSCQSPTGRGSLSAGHLSWPQVLVGHTRPSHIVCRSQQFLRPERNCDPPRCPGLSHRSLSRLQTHLAFLPSLLASWPPGRRVGSELEYLRFRGRPGPRRAGLRELSSLLGATEKMLNLKAPPAHWRASPCRAMVSSALRVMAVRWKPRSGALSGWHCFLLYPGT